jgi:hypothetical protein
LDTGLFPALAAEKAIRPSALASIEALMLCSRGGHAMLARIAVIRTLNRGEVVPFNPDAKKHHWGKRKLKRDQ